MATASSDFVLEKVLEFLDSSLLLVVLINELVLLLVVVWLNMVELVSLMVVVLWSAEDQAWDGAEHDWDADDGDKKEEVGESLLTGEPVLILWSVRSHNSHEVVDSDSDDGWTCAEVWMRVSSVWNDTAVKRTIWSIGVDWVPPLGINHNDHDSNEAHEDEKTGDDIEHDYLPSAEVDRVEELADDSEVKMEEGDNDGDLFLGSVCESKLVGWSKGPGWIKTEWIHAILL